MTAQEIQKLCEESEYWYFGIRADYMKYSIGDECETSHQLYQDPQYADDAYSELLFPRVLDPQSPYYGLYDAGELNGTCALGFDPEDLDSIEEMLKRADNYPGDRVHVIGGNRIEYGEDENEIIIRDAIVIWARDKEEE